MSILENLALIERGEQFKLPQLRLREPRPGFEAAASYSLGGRWETARPG